MTKVSRFSLALAVVSLTWPCASPAITLHVTDDVEIQIRGKSHSSYAPKDSKHSEPEFDDDSPDQDRISVRYSRHGKQSIGLVKFDTSPLPADTHIERAILRIWIGELRQSGRLNLHDVLEGWQEHTFRGKHLPPLGPVFHSFSIDDSDEQRFVTAEVTTVVQSWLNNPETNFGLALASDHPDGLHVEIDSKENRRTSHPMEIEVTLAPGVGPEGPQGIEGPKGDTGPPGPAVSLLMLGKSCPTGEFLTGFDGSGNIICSPLPATNPTGPSPVQDVNPGDVIITELMVDPSSVSDSNGEWIEIYNLRSDTVDISGWSIEEASGNIHTISANAPILIPPGEFLVLGPNADVTTNGGISIGYQYAGITLNNSGDTITLRDINEEPIDQVDYGTGQFPISAGVSLNLDPDHFDSAANDDGSFWCQSHTLIGSGPDSGTPGAANDPCP